MGEKRISIKDLEHYCEGRWIPGSTGLCSAGIPREDHVLYLSKEAKDD